MKMIIKNISELIQTEEKSRKWVSGKNMAELNTIKDAFIEIDNGKISSFGCMDNWKGIEDWNSTEVIDAEGGVVFPSYCDSHTHLVFAESREQEFVDRINGLTYQEISKKGGGILNSAKKMQQISEEELIRISLSKLRKVIETGTGAIEIKSGYGLNLKSEIKILKVIKKLQEISPLTIKSTFLGAHAVPEEYSKERYLELIIKEMLPQIQEENLADYVDVFCEKGYFNIEDTIKILEESNKLGIKGKVHVNQFNAFGGVEASVNAGVISVDHLEEMREEDFTALIGSNCMPTLLPSCSFFLGIPYAPAREMMKRNLPIALATDYNPGSAPNSNMNFVSSLGCIKMKMTPNEVINSTTINSAYAMGIEKEVGSICIGKTANLFITKKIPSYSYLHYSYGENLINKVILNGKIINKKTD